MSPISNYTLELLAKKDLSSADYDWVMAQIEGLHIVFDNPAWPVHKAEALHTQPQIGYLTGLMDIESDEERYEALEIITGLHLFWDITESYPGSEVEVMDHPEQYPGKSSKDLRINRWMTSVLIEYYLNGEGSELNETLGYTTASAVREEERRQREADKAAQAAHNALGGGQQQSLPTDTGGEQLPF